MKIVVDTKKDSKEDIRKVIAVLSTFLDRQDNYPNYSANIFSNSQSAGVSGASAPSSQSDSPSIFSIFDSKDTKPNYTAGNATNLNSDREDDEELPKGTPEIEVY